MSTKWTWLVRKVPGTFIGTRCGGAIARWSVCCPVCGDEREVLTSVKQPSALATSHACGFCVRAIRLLHEADPKIELLQ